MWMGNGRRLYIGHVSSSLYFSIFTLGVFANFRDHITITYMLILCRCGIWVVITSSFGNPCEKVVVSHGCQVFIENPFKVETY